ncbi:hypothetical protein AHAS_Ahas19G0116500 [Arachis hypogaea]
MIFLLPYSVPQNLLFSAIIELLTILGFEDIGKNALLYGGGGGGGDGDGDRGGGEKNSTDGFVGFQAMMVPPFVVDVV